MVQVIAQLAPIELHHIATPVAHRDHQRPRQVLVPRRSDHAERLQLAAQLGARLAVLRRQAVAERAIGIAQAEMVDQLLIAQATALKHRQRLRALPKRLRVKADDALKQLALTRTDRQRHTRQARRHPRLAAPPL
jgi:K+-sensing histidine kinase KdpD